MRYSRREAESDAAAERFAEYVSGALEELTEPLVRTIEGMDLDAEYPHPWTYERHLAQVWQDDGDDGLAEYLAEEYREEAEEMVRDRGDGGPCCNQFSCPCGNGNNRPD